MEALTANDAIAARFEPSGFALAVWNRDVRLNLNDALEAIFGQLVRHIHPRFSREPKPHHPRNIRVIPKSRDFH